MEATGGADGRCAGARGYARAQCWCGTCARDHMVWQEHFPSPSQAGRCRCPANKEHMVPPPLQPMPLPLLQVQGLVLWCTLFFCVICTRAQRWACFFSGQVSPCAYSG